MEVKVQEVSAEVLLEINPDFRSEMLTLILKQRALTFKKSRGLKMDKTMHGTIKRTIQKWEMFKEETVLCPMKQWL